MRRIELHEPGGDAFEVIPADVKAWGLAQMARGLPGHNGSISFVDGTTRDTRETRDEITKIMDAVPERS